MQAAGFVIFWFVGLFGCAGRLDWMRGWVYLGLALFGMLITFVAIQSWNPTLMEARSKFHQENTKRFDVVIMSIFLPLQMLQPAVGGLDARFGWSHMPMATLYWGAILVFLASAWIGWALAVNRFAEASVRIQKERGQIVVSWGPYRFVRHPMYAGLLVMYPAGALVLGSFWVLAMAGLIVALLIVRTVLEDRTLHNELPGYGEYAAQTRYRLLPGLW
jgi:protein-S-isoprenylcysteine O-methyltransferase Ste14